MRYHGMAMPKFKNHLDERITAAAALHGWGKRDLRAQLAKAEIEMLLAEDIIKGKKPLKGRNLRDLCYVLEVPPAWFTAEDWRPLIKPAAESESELAQKVDWILHLLLETEEAESVADAALGALAPQRSPSSQKPGEHNPGLPGHEPPAAEPGAR